MLVGQVFCQLSYFPNFRLIGFFMSFLGGLVFRDRVSLCSFVEQAGLKLAEICLPLGDLQSKFCRSCWN